MSFYSQKLPKLKMEGGETALHQEFNEFVRWQIQNRIFDLNAKYVSR